MFANFTAGASYALKGFSLIRRPGLRRYAVLPVLINLVLFSALSWYGMSQFKALVDRFLPEDSGWWAGALTIVAAILVGLTLLVIVFFSFTLVLNLVGSPFNGLLAEKVERVLSHQAVATPGGAGRFFASIFLSIKAELRKYLYFAILGLGVLIVTLLLNIVPGLGVLLAPLLSFLFGSWVMALEYLAYPMDNHDILFPEVRKWARGNRMLSLGFGVMVLLLTITPLVNLVVMPAAVAGATLMWSERKEFFGTSGVA